MPELLNSSESDSKKNGRQLEKIMLTTDKWNFLQELIYILGPFEEATQHLGGEKYVTHSIMHPILKEIKRLLLLPPSTSSTPSTPSTSFTSSTPSTSFISTTSFISSEPLTSSFTSEIENANDVFVLIE